MSHSIEHRIRIRSAANDSDVLVVSSVRGGTNPFLVDAPQCDGAEFDPLTGAYRSGQCNVRIADAIVSGTDRVVTSMLEDADARQQLAGRPAYVEFRRDGGSWECLQAGIITSIRLSSAAVWDIAVGDTMRATRGLVAFAPKRDADDATKIEPLADYLERWPTRGTIAGGPVLGGFLGLADRGGWEYRVAGSYASGAVKYLRFVSGYQAPSFDRTTDALAVDEQLNKAAGSHAVSQLPNTFPNTDGLNPTEWPDLLVQIDGANFSPASVAVAGGLTPDGHAFGFDAYGLSFVGGGISGIYVYDNDDVLSVGLTIRRVRIFDALPSERCPIYYTGHPLDLFTKLLDEADLTYDSSAVTATKNALGTSLRLNLRITSTQDLSQFLTSVLFGPCGFSARTDENGALVPFTTRVTSNTLPLTTITAADVPDGQTVLFELSEPDAITKLTFEQLNLVPSTRNDTNAPPDGINVQSVRVERTSGDAGGNVQREQSYSIPGFITTQPTGGYEAGYVDGVALELFDRYGRGRLTGGTPVLATGEGADLLLGDEMIVALPAMPNANARIGDDDDVSGRCVQIVSRTPVASGAILKFVDSGPNAQPVATLPTLSLSSGTGPGVILATITNAATLNTAGIGARVQWAQVSSGTPSSSAYTDVMAFSPGAIPTDAFALPSAIAGNDVYVKARSEQPGLRPSNYSSAVHLATTGFSAPTSLDATPNATDGTRAALTWVTGTGASTRLVDVFVRLSSESAAADVQRQSLLPESVGYELDHLVPDTEYVASVRHRDLVSGQVTGKTTVTFTTSADGPDLLPPSDAAVFAGEPGGGASALDGSYGLAVVATQLPGDVEFQEAVETGVGAGTFGSYASVGQTPGILGSWTRLTLTAPNDGLLRRLRARSVVAASTSDWTDAITVAPWSVVELPPYPGTQPLTGRIVVDTLAGGTRLVSYYVADPIPSSGIPITLLASPSGFADASGTPFDAVTPASDTLTLPDDAITSDLGTTAFAQFFITPSPIGGSTGRVNFSASRPGRVSSQPISIDIAPLGSDMSRPIIPAIVLEAEATAAGGTQATGMVYVPLTFTPLIDHYLVYTAESPSAGTAVPDRSDAYRAIQVKRIDGLLESADDWQTMVMIATGAVNYRAVVVVAVGPTGLQSDPFQQEIQAVDTGTPPTGAPTDFTVSYSTVSGVARAACAWTVDDAAAQHVLVRNGSVIAVLAPTVDAFDDDGITPGGGYLYDVFAWRNGQSSAEVADSPTTTTAPTPTLDAPSWQSGYPVGHTDHLTSDGRVLCYVSNPDPLANTDLWMSAADSDAGFSQIDSIPPGATIKELSATTLSLALGDGRYFYLTSSRSGYTTSSASSHERAVFGDAV